MTLRYALAALMVAANGASLVVACGGASSQDDAATAAKEAACLTPVMARYADAVIAACPDRDVRPDCFRAHPELAANLHADEVKEGCR